jgi:hypothetical protein
VPDVEFMIVCEYVRAEPGGILHMMAAGIDRIFASAIPAARNLGVAVRLSIHDDELGKPLRVELAFRQEAEDTVLARAIAVQVPEYPPDAERDEPLGVVLGINVGLPLPSYGRYVLELLIGGQPAKTARLTVAPPPPVVDPA